MSSTAEIFELARSILENGTLLPTHYEKRASILQNLSLFKRAITNYTRKIKRLNANCNVAHLSEYLFKDQPSYIFTRSCTHCNTIHSRVSAICHINVDILLQGLQNVQRAIKDTKISNSKCESCGKIAESSFTYGTQIVIDTFVFTDSTYADSNTKHDLNLISKVINLNNSNYVLAEIVHYISYGKKESVITLRLNLRGPIGMNTTIAKKSVYYLMLRKLSRRMS